MTYPREWQGDDEGPAGLAIFVVDGLRYEMRLATFTAFQNVGKMLDAAFDQGKGFAYEVVKSSVERGISDARIKHAL